MAAHAVTRCRLTNGQILHLITDLADSMVGEAIRRSGCWEPTETALMQTLVAPGDIAADIGAHVGYFTVLLSKCVGPTGRVVAFEPETGNFEFLKANCILNGCTNVVLRRARWPIGAVVPNSIWRPGTLVIIACMRRAVD